MVSIPAQDFTPILNVNLNERLLSSRWHSIELSDSRRSIEVRLYHAIVDRETNDFPQHFSASLDFNARPSPDTRQTNSLGGVKGEVHLDPSASQFPITSTRISRTIAGRAKVVFLYEWKFTIPLSKALDELPPLLDGILMANCRFYEQGWLCPGYDAVRIFTLYPPRRSSSNAEPTLVSPPGFANLRAIMSATNDPGRIQLSVAQEGPLLRITSSPARGVKILERMAFDRLWMWEAVDRTTNEVPVWYAQPQNDGTAFRVRVE